MDTVLAFYDYRLYKHTVCELVDDTAHTLA